MFWTLLIFTLGLSPYQRSNVEIQRLVELLKTVILNDCAASTVSSYAGAANRWIDWCKSYSFRPLQCNPTAVALYLTSLSDRGLSRSSILGAAYGIAWLHKKLGMLILLTIRSFLRPWLVLNASWLAHLRKSSLLNLITSGR